MRRTDVTFSDVQEAAAGVFLLYQRYPYYFANLGTRRLEEQVQGIEGQIQELLQLVGVLRRRVVPVRDVTPLANARAALFELETVLVQSGRRAHGRPSPPDRDAELMGKSFEIVTINDEEAERRREPGASGDAHVRLA